MTNPILPVLPTPQITTGFIRYTEQQLREYGRECWMAGWHYRPTAKQKPQEVPDHFASVAKANG